MLVVHSNLYLSIQLLTALSSSHQTAIRCLQELPLPPHYTCGKLNASQNIYHLHHCTSYPQHTNNYINYYIFTKYLTHLTNNMSTQINLLGINKLQLAHNWYIFFISTQINLHRE